MQTFFDRLEAVVYHSAQWQTVEEAQQVVQGIGDEAALIKQNMPADLKSGVQRLYDQWQPETDEGQLYKDQLRELIG